MISVEEIDDFVTYLTKAFDNISSYDIQMFIRIQTTNALDLIDTNEKAFSDKTDHPEIISIVTRLKEKLKDHPELEA